MHEHSIFIHVRVTPKRVLTGRPPQPREHKVTHEVFFEMEADGKPLGTVVVGLFGDTVPRTVKNFITFASKGYAGFKYEGTPIHRVIKKFMIQGENKAVYAFICINMRIYPSKIIYLCVSMCVWSLFPCIYMNTQTYIHARVSEQSLHMFSYKAKSTNAATVGQEY